MWTVQVLSSPGKAATCSPPSRIPAKRSFAAFLSGDVDAHLIRLLIDAYCTWFKNTTLFRQHLFNLLLDYLSQAFSSSLTTNFGGQLSWEIFFMCKRTEAWDHQQKSTAFAHGLKNSGCHQAKPGPLHIALTQFHLVLVDWDQQLDW